MKDKTKQTIVIGAAGAAVIYFLTRPKDEEAGGFGGGGGIPLLPGDTEDAAEADTIINYILPKPEEPVDWGIDPDPLSKKATYAPSLIPTYPLEYYTAGGISELSAAATQPQKLKSVMELQHYADPFAYAFSGRRDAPADISGIVDSKKDAAIAQTPKEKPVQWGEASVGGFMDYLYPLTQLGEGARGRDVATRPDKDIRGSVETKKVASSRYVSTVKTVPSKEPILSTRKGTYTKKGMGSGSSPYRSTSVSRMSSRFSTGQKGSGY